MGIAVFWALFGALIGLSAARIKGLGNAAGIIGGLLLGPFAVLMFLCSGNMKRCPNCAQWVEKPALQCYCCGYQFMQQNTAGNNVPNVQPYSPKENPPDAPVSWASTPTVRPQPQAAAAEEEIRIPCPFCGEAILPVAKKCRYCGSILERQPPQPATLTEEQVKVICPACGQKLLLNLADNGKNFNCPTCNYSFTLEISDGHYL